MARIWGSWIRNYSRWRHRLPAKIHTPEMETSLKQEEVIDLGPMAKHIIGSQSTYENAVESGEKKSKRSVKSKSNPSRKNSSFNYAALDKLSNISNKDSNMTVKDQIVSKNITPKSEITKKIIKDPNVFNEDGSLAYMRLPYNDMNISNLLIKLKSRKERGRCGLILVEGWRFIVDGLKAGCVLEKVLFSNTKDLDKIKPFLPKKDVEILKMPYKEIQQWSNLDTCPGLMGIFKTPDINKMKMPQCHYPINIICDNVREPGNLGSVLRAALGVGCKQLILTKGCVDVWDPKVLRSAAGAHFKIPVHAELSWDDISLKSDITNSSIFIADNNCEVMGKSILAKSQPYFYENRVKNEASGNSTVENKIETDFVKLPLLPYYDVKFSALSSITIVIGGETEGISEDCYIFGDKNKAIRLNIPLTTGMDSLNTGMALAVIAFEAKRQFMSAFSTISEDTEIKQINMNI